MARTEATNTFGDGLMSDLHPINMPNTALSDCLNGTVITYDGNEYSLQSEQGNYALKNCKLHSGYIPVGVKEHGDIIYIVSHNPITNRTQIGSYPSPQTLSEFPGKTFNPVDITLVTDGIHTFSEIQEKSNLTVFYGAVPEECKLNPGDEYKIDWYARTKEIECLKYYIIDENRKLWDITNYVEQDAKKDEVLHKISWDVPGWLAIRPEVIDIKEFKINVKEAKSPQYVRPSADRILSLVLNLQIIVEDDYTVNKFTQTGLSVPFGADIAVSGFKNNAVPNFNWKYINNGNGTVTFYTDIDFKINNTGRTLDSTIVTVTATPKITSDNSTILYDKRTLQRSFDITQIGDASLFKLGESKWRYSMDDKLFTLYFDTSGISANAIFNEDLFLTYTLQHLHKNGSTMSLVPIGSRTLVANWNVSGDTDITIPFSTTLLNNKLTDSSYCFRPEDIYIITFEIFDNSDFISTTPLNSFIKPIIASKLMTSFSEEPRYDLIEFDRWLANYDKFIENQSVKINEFKINTSSVSTDSEVRISDNAKDFWLSNTQRSKKYKTFKDDDDLRGMKMSGKNEFTVSCGVTSSASVKSGSNISLLTGPLWDELNATSRIAITNKINNTTSTRSFGITNGKLAASDEFESIGNTTLELINKYMFDDLSGSIRLWDYEEKDMNYHYNISTIYTDADKDDDYLYIKGTIAGSNTTGRYVNNVTSYNIPTLQAIYKALDTYDALLCKIYTNVSDKGGWVEGVIVKLGWVNSSNGTTPNGDVTKIMESGKDGESGIPLYCVAFKVKSGGYERIQFVPLTQSTDGLTDASAKTMFIDWCTKIKHIVPSKDGEMSGKFIIANLISESGDTLSATVSAAGLLIPGSFTYSGINLFDAQARSSLFGWNQNISHYNLFTENANIQFGQIALESATYTSNFTADNTNVELTQKINDAKAKLRNIESSTGAIGRRNAEVIKEYDDYKQDKVLQGSASEYYTSSGSHGNYDIYIDILNDKKATTHNILLFNKYRWDWNWTTATNINLGLYDPSFKIDTDKS